MGRPMAEIQGASRAELEWITGRGDVVQVQLCASVNQAFHGCRLEIPQSLGIALDNFKKLPVTNERHLDRLDVAGSFVARRKRGQQLKIIYDRIRWSKRADEILL